VLTAELDHWPGEVVVQLAAGSPQTKEDELARDYNLAFVVSETNTLVDRRIVRYQFGGQRTAATVAAALAADPRVSGAQPNWRYRVIQGARNQARASASLQYASIKLGLADAHVIARGRGVKVAVIDSGVDRTHPALADAISRSFNAAGNRGKEIGAHGTAIAGILKAQGLLKGVAPAAELLAVRAFFSNSAGGEEQSSTAIIMRALDWAVRHEARIVNMSFAGPRDAAVEEAVAAARKRGVILIAAAGNGGPEAAPAFPAAYQDVIAVTATDTQDRLYGKANRGPYIDVAAPGVDIFVVAPARAYRHSSGTSLAAAHVSGIVALLLERDASLDGAAVADILKQGAADLGKPGLDPDFGAGRVDTLKLLRAATVEIAKPAGR
jgi:subtilisin family serine protease